MKRKMWVIAVVGAAIFFAADGMVAQDGKKMDKGGMDMAEMKKSPRHALMMGHHHSSMAFATILRDTTAGGKFADIEVARNAFAEIKHGMDQMVMISRMHMSGMNKEMMEKMKPMMAADKAGLNEHIAALERAFQMEAPDAAEVNKHAAELVRVFEKMMPMDKKMDMSGKKPM